MDYTTNYNLNKPTDNEKYTKDHQNSNMDIIDAKLKEHEDAINEQNVKLNNFYFYQTSITVSDTTEVANIKFGDGTNGLYLVLVTDTDYEIVSNKGLVLLMDVRNSQSYRHILSSSGVTLSGHSNSLVAVKGAKNYLLKSFRLIAY